MIKSRIISSGAVKRAAAVGLIGAVLAGCGGGNDYAALYRDYSDRMTERGLFRQDAAPADAPYGDADLSQNLLKVLFVPETQLLRFYEGGAAARRLSKWTGPIRYQFSGDGVTEADRAAVRDIASSLGRHSGLAIGPASPGDEGDMTIFIMSAEAREAIGESESRASWYRSSILRDWVEKPNPPCFAIFDAGDAAGGAIESAAIFLKSEMVDPLRRACLVEEFTQALGLVFDHDDVRPSIFNDDQEFIALTNHDRELIEILYDPRLVPGMTARQAAPIIQRIVAERRRRGATLAAAGL